MLTLQANVSIGLINIYTSLHTKSRAQVVWSKTTEQSLSNINDECGNFSTSSSLVV